MILRVFTASRVFLGLGAGAAFYMLLVSGALAGEGFPDMDGADPERVRERVTEAAVASLNAVGLDSDESRLSIERLAETIACGIDSREELRDACQEFAAAVYEPGTAPATMSALAANVRADLSPAASSKNAFFRARS